MVSRHCAPLHSFTRGLRDRENFGGFAAVVVGRGAPWRLRAWRLRAWPYREDFALVGVSLPLLPVRVAFVGVARSRPAKSAIAGRLNLELLGVQLSHAEDEFEPARSVLARSGATPRRAPKLHSLWFLHAWPS